MMGQLTKETLAKRINEVSRLTGEFTLRSGATSNTYFDKYCFEAYPDLLQEVARHIVKQNASVLTFADAHLLGGLEMGGIPIATMVSFITRYPCVFVRKEAKTHGTCKYAEGPSVESKRIVLIEDVVSSGGAVIDAVKRLRADGAIVEFAICVIDRESGGADALGGLGVTLSSLFTKSYLDEIAQA